MIDPFFEYFDKYRDTISRRLYSRSGVSKSYEWCPSVKLPRPLSLEEVSLQEALLDRKSTFDFTAVSLTFEQVATVLLYSAGTRCRNGTNHRTHPSAGAQYAIELYIAVPRRVMGLNEGLYHVNIPKETLEQIHGSDTIPLVVEAFPRSSSNRSVFTANVLVFLSFNKERLMPKYGSLAYKAGLIESGHVGQNIYITAAGLKIGCRALLGGEWEKLNDLFYLDGINETIMYALALGSDDTLTDTRGG